MQWSDLPRNPSSRMLRQFAGLWIVFFGAMAAWRWWELDQRGAAIILAVLALVVGTIGLIAPRAIRPIFVGWLVLAFPVGWVVSHVVMAVLYWLVMTPVAFVFRLRGRDLLQRRRPIGATTYWRQKEQQKDVASYFRQY